MPFLLDELNTRPETQKPGGRELREISSDPTGFKKIIVPCSYRPKRWLDNNLTCTLLKLIPFYLLRTVRKLFQQLDHEPQVSSCVDKIGRNTFPLFVGQAISRLLCCVRAILMIESQYRRAFICYRSARGHCWRSKSSRNVFSSLAD